MSYHSPSADSDLEGLLRALEEFETPAEDAGNVPREAVDAYRHAIEALHAEALRRLLRVLRDDPAAMPALRRAATDDVVYAVLRRHGLLKPSVNERVEAALAKVRPMLASHGGDVRLVDVLPPTVEVELLGTCGNCASSSITLYAGVKKAIEEACPEITNVKTAKGPSGGAGARLASPFASDRAAPWVPVGALGQIPEGGIFAVKIGPARLILSRRGRAVSCFENACAHLGLALHEGAVENGIVTCPHHGFRYDLATGECLTAPEVQLQSHAVRLVGDHVEVRLAA